VIIPVNDLGQIGLVTDLPYAKVPLNAWSRVQNMRFREGAAEKMKGESEVYASPICAPYWLLASSGFWLYAGLTQVGATDGSTHADISRTSGGAYTADAADSWTGTVIEGIPVIANPVDVPQMWNTPALATPLTALSNWPSTVRCKALRRFKRYLVALDITKSGTRYPTMVKWSHEAAVGAVPSSWDETDPTVDAAEYTCNSEGGELMDLVMMRDTGIIYSKYWTHRMDFVGGIDIFRINTLFNSVGAINHRCAIEFFTGKQIVFTGDDLVIHDGVTAKSLLDNRCKRLLRGTVDSAKYRQAYVAANYISKEVWCAYTETGYSHPNKAIVWSWISDTCSVRELPGADFILSGTVTPGDDLWSSSGTSWESDTGVWSDGSTAPNERRMLIASGLNTKLYTPEASNQFDQTSMTAFAERQDIGYPLKVQGPPDFTTEKFFRGLYPHITGTDGGVVNVYLGTQDKIGGSITWQTAVPFTIGTSDFIDPMATGRMFALRFESTGDIEWKISGYDADVVPVGKF